MRRETVTFRRRAELPGVEIRDVENSARRWRCFATGYEFLVPHTWHGEIRHRRRQEPVAPGMVFCIRPEEVFTTPRVLVPGNWSALTIDPDVFHAHVAQHGIAPGGFDLKTFVAMSEALSSKMRALFQAMTPAAPLLELRSCVTDVVAALVDEVVAGPRRTPPPRRDDAAALAAVESHLSRFQMLRHFKHKYGLPPHAYQLRVRIGLAQRALRAGSPAADVAAEQGFVDQSHFSRHFKQLVGVTPVAYARAA
jgi:AraC-like DNA-binding protein